MQGVNIDGNPYIDPITKMETRFMYSGDPIDNSGWTFSVTGYPRECYFQTNSGPFTMAPGQRQQIVIALVAAQGIDRVNSVARLKTESRLLIESFRRNTKAEVSEFPFPDHATLYQNFPNPCTAATTLA